jgi:hypothetical protein
MASAVMLLAPACVAGGSRIELSSPELAIATYQDTMAPPTGVYVKYRGEQLIVQSPDPVAAPWLSVDVSDQRGSAVIQVFTNVNSVGPGTYRAVVTLALPSGEHTELPITFMVRESFRLSTTALDVRTTLDGGGNTVGARLGILGTQSRWSIGGVPPWLVPEQLTGDGSRDVELVCDKSAIATPSIVAAELQVTDAVGGRVIVLPVRCIADSHRLLPARHGVAFSQFPNVTALTTDVVVDHNGSTAVDWSASAAPGWLSVSERGRSGQALHIVADPGGLAPGVHIGVVTIRSDARTIARPETVRVGLYISADPLPNPVIHREPAASTLGDPIRPYRYVLRNSTRLEAHNLYTARVENVYSLPIPTLYVRICDVSDDGKYLYFEVLAGYDGSNPFAQPPREVWRVDLDDERAVPRLLFTEHGTEQGVSNGPFPVRYVSNNGVPLLFNPFGRLHRADTGEVLASFLWNWYGSSLDPLPVYRDTLVSIVPSGKHMALTNAGGGSFTAPQLYRIDAYDVSEPIASVTLETSIPKQMSSEPGAMLLGGDLDRIYLRFGYFEKIDTTWVFHSKFRSAQHMLDAGHGALFGTGSDSAGDLVVGEYTKDGDLVTKLSHGSGPGWDDPLLSSDGLMVFATTADQDGTVTYGFRR